MSTTNNAEAAQAALDRTRARLKLPSGMHALLCAPNRYIDCRYVYDVIEDANGIDALVPFRLTVHGESGKPEVQGIKKGYARPLKYHWVKDCPRMEIRVSDYTWRMSTEEHR